MKSQQRMKRQKESKRGAHHLFTEAPLLIRVIFNLFPNLHKIKSPYSSRRSEPERDGKGCSRTIPTPFPGISLGDKRMLSHLPLIRRLVFLDYQY